MTLHSVGNARQALSFYVASFLLHDPFFNCLFHHLFGLNQTPGATKRGGDIMTDTPLFSGCLTAQKLDCFHFLQLTAL